MGERAFKGVWIPSEVWLSDELTIYDKAVYAEIDSLDGENHCWASNEYLAKFCKMSEVTISRSISKLIQLGFIERLSFDGRQRVLAVNRSKFISETSQTYLGDKSEISQSENLLLIENKKENSREGTVAGALAKHPRNFSKNTLTDDLQSGKDIDEQKKTKKKASEYDKCLAEIGKRYEDPKLYAVVVSHFEWSYNSKKPNRIKTLETLKRRLDELDNLSGDKIKIVQQSIKKQWHCFYEIKDTKSGVRSTKDNVGINISTLTEKEKKQMIAERVERNGVI